MKHNFELRANEIRHLKEVVVAEAKHTSDAPKKIQRLEAQLDFTAFPIVT